MHSRIPSCGGGHFYYYELEEWELTGGRLRYGPVRIDWDGNGVPDDEELPCFTRGELNLDGRFDVSDVIFLLDLQFAEGPAPDCLKAADLNDDGRIEIGDAIYGLAYLLADGPVIPPPFEACGPDLTADPLRCATPPADRKA